MIETPQEGREGIRAAVLLAKVQQIRISELVCSGMWFCFLLHSASSYKCFSFSIRVTMTATVRRQRPRRLLCWALVAVLLADLLALSGMYLAEVSKKSKEEGTRFLLNTMCSHCLLLSSAVESDSEESMSVSKMK